MPGERFSLGGLGGRRKAYVQKSEWVLFQERERKSCPVIINSFLLLTKKLHLVCGRVLDLDVGLHL